MATSKYVTLISSDALEFVVLREAALVSPTIKAMLRSPFIEAQTGRCRFPEIRYVLSLCMPVFFSPPSFSYHDDTRCVRDRPLSQTMAPIVQQESPDCMSVVYT
jgi:hypothetical protein